MTDLKHIIFKYIINIYVGGGGGVLLYVHGHYYVANLARGHTYHNAMFSKNKHCI